MSKRKTISQRLRIELLYIFGRSCCICQQHFLKLQIHHIDGDPGNNDPENLIVLCKQHHDEVETSGGNAIQYSEKELKRWRKEWLELVQRRRKAYENRSVADEDCYWKDHSHEKIIYAIAGHEIRKKAYEIDHMDWEKTNQVLKSIYPYTSHSFEGNNVKIDILDLLQDISDFTRNIMPAEIAINISDIIQYILPIPSLSIKAQREPNKTEIYIYERALYITHDLIYDSVKYIKDISIVAAGAEVLYVLLRFAHLNENSKLKNNIIGMFDEMISLSKEYNLLDYEKWLVFQRENALALPGEPYPLIPEDVYDKIKHR